jgi:hypothetical protein
MTENLIHLLSPLLDHLFVVAAVLALLVVGGKSLLKKPRFLVFAVIAVGVIAGQRFLAADPEVRAREQADTDRAKLTELARWIDELHHYSVRNETHNYRKHFRFSHLAGKEYYHRRCQLCVRNFQVRRRMDAIYLQHPEWTKENK